MVAADVRCYALDVNVKINFSPAADIFLSTLKVQPFCLILLYNKCLFSKHARSFETEDLKSNLSIRINK